MIDNVKCSESRVTGSVVGGLVPSVFATFVIFLILYEPDFRLQVFGSYISAVIIAALYFFAFRSSISLHLGVSKQELLIIGLLVFSLVFILFVVASAGGDVSKALHLVIYLGFVVPFAAVVLLIFLGNRGMEFFLSIIAVAAFLQALLMFGEFFSETISAALDEIVSRPELVHSSYRVSGISSMTGDGLSFVQFIGFSSAFSLAYLFESVRHNKVWYFLAAVIFVSMLFAGRTGLLLSTLFVLAVLAATSWRRLLTFAFSGSFVIAFLVVAFAVPGAFVGGFGVSFRHALEPFISLASGSGFRVSSINDLLNNHLVFPDSIRVWMLGAGQWGDANTGGNYMGTDIGYLRMIWYVGLPASLMIYSWYLYALVPMWRARPDLKYYLFPLFFCLFVAHFKFPFLLGSQAVFFVLLIFFSVMRERSYSGLMGAK